MIARAIARDQGGGKDTAKLMSTIMIIFGMAPLLAPLIGSGILLFSTWHGIFLFLALFTFSLIIIAKVWIAPSRVGADRIAEERVPLTFRLIVELFTHKDFLMGTLVMTTLFGGYAAILSIGAAMTATYYDISPTGFGVLFALSASSIMIGPAISRVILGRSSVRTPIKLGAALAGIVGLSFLLCVQQTVPLALLWSLVFLYCLSFSVMMPAANTVALEPAAHAAGTASSLLSSLPTMGGAVGAALASSALFDNSYEALCYMLAGGGILSCLIVVTFNSSRENKASETA